MVLPDTTAVVVALSIGTELRSQRLGLSSSPDLVEHVQGLCLDHGGGIEPAKAGADGGDVVKLLLARNHTGCEVQDFVDGCKVFSRPVTVHGEAVADMG